MRTATTKWFPRGSKPDLIGVYETLPEAGDSMSWFQYWDGEFWKFCGRNAERAMMGRHDKSMYQTPRWRGLANKPDSA